MQTVITGNKKVNIGVDLDGVVAQHSLGGFWVLMRRMKESLLLSSNSHYYYPSTKIERLAWCQINRSRIPFTQDKKVISEIANYKKAELYLITSRFKFLEDLTHEWLGYYGLGKLFKTIQINVNDEDPYIYKENAIRKFKLDIFVDDDLEVLRHLKRHVRAKLYWVVPRHKKESDNNDNSVVCVNNFCSVLKDAGVL